MKKGSFSILPIVVLTMFQLLGSANAADRCPKSNMRNSDVCRLENLSWVTAQFFNEESEQSLRKEISQFQSDIRGYARRAMPILEHETLNIWSSESAQMADSELIKKAFINCVIGVTSGNVAAAFYIECKLKSFLKVWEGCMSSIENSALGLAAPKDINSAVDNYLRTVIDAIGNDFYTRLSRYEQDQ